MSEHPILTLIIIGLIIRIPISIFLTHSYDVKYWATILENLESGNSLYGISGYYYTPVWGYFIAVIGLFATTVFNISTLGTQSDAFVFAQGTEWGYYADLLADPWYSMIYKMVFTLCDLLIALLLYKIVKEYTSDKRKATIAFILWWLCPLTIYTANVHAMFDSLPILITLLAVYFLLKDQPLFAGIALGIAALCKLFPAYLMFIFIAYVIAKNYGNKEKIRKDVLIAVIGAVASILVILIPNIMDGNLLQAFGMISNRVGEISGNDGESAWDSLVSNGYLIVVIFQPIILVLEILIARKMTKTRENHEKTFFHLAMFSATCIFLWTPTPTYLMLVIPFVIMHSLINDKVYLNAYYAMAIFGVLYAIVMHNYSDLIIASDYFHLVSAETITNGIEFMDREIFSGMTVQSLTNFIFGALETFAVYSVFLIMILKYRKSRRTVPEQLA